MNLHETLNDRENKYGDFAVLAEAVQALKALARAAPSWQYMSVVQREAMEMAIIKQARILYGDPNIRDSWLDMAGYPHLVVEALDKAEAQKPRMEMQEGPVDLDELADNITKLPKVNYP